MSLSLFYDVKKRFEERIKGKKGAPEKRAKFMERWTEMQKRWLQKANTWRMTVTPQERQAYREKSWRAKKAVELAEKAGRKFDEHGSGRGDYTNTAGIDFVGPWEGSAKSPYWDMGGEGLGLVCITRKRVYAKSSRYRPSFATTYYLVGKNEAGTYFTHPVPQCRTVREAVEWIWDGRAESILERQGDIALIKGAGPKGLDKLPDGHKLEGFFIVHETHPPLMVPGKGERIIVGRRAAMRVSEATRD